MQEVILCLVALCFTAWILVLTSEVQKLKAENKKLRAELSRLVR